MTDEHRIAAAVTLRHYTEPDNLPVIRAESKADIRKALRAGTIDTSQMPSHEDYQVEELWRSAEARASAEQDRIRRLKGGSAGVLDFGDDYDQMVLVCRNRRTTLGRLTAEDRRLMAKESARNRVEVDTADDAEQVAANADILILERYADYESYDRQRRAREAAS